jgi:hypothetical protein
MSRKSVVVTAACGALLLSGCGSEDEAANATPGPTTVQMPVSGHSLLIAGPADQVADERLTGKPVFVNGCLGAQTGTQTFLVVWPDGTTVAGSDSDALEYDGEVLEPGGSFVGRGRFVVAQPFPEQFPEIPLKCLGPNQEKIAWVQEIDEIQE